MPGRGYPNPEATDSRGFVILLGTCALSMNLPSARGIYAASLIASRATLKRHECRAPSVRFMVALAPTIQNDLAMDDQAYGNIVNLFLVAYTLAYLVAGRLTDLLGTELIEEKGAAAPSIETRWTWKQVLTFKETWLLLLGRLLTDAVWYFYQFWFRKYLSTIRSR